MMNRSSVQGKSPAAMFPSVCGVINYPKLRLRITPSVALIAIYPYSLFVPQRTMPRDKHRSEQRFVHTGYDFVNHIHKAECPP
jgi:hypothetical protein